MVRLKGKGNDVEASIGDKDLMERFYAMLHRLDNACKLIKPQQLEETKHKELENEAF